jgi:ribosomal protein S18 acetylase RimI-like enzyme
MEVQDHSQAGAEALTCTQASWRDWIAAWVLDSLAAGPDAWGPMQLLMALVSAHVRLKVTVDGRLAGLLFGERRAQACEGWVLYLAVHPQFRLRGIARCLLGEAERLLALPVTKLTVRPSNQIALALYAATGYGHAERLTRYYPDEDGQVMVKPRPAPRS